MNEHSDKIKGLIGTIICHAIILLAILLLAMKTPLPLPGEEGVEVDLGYSDQGMGMIQPDEPAPPEVEQSQAQPPELQPDEEVLTQEVEETPVSKPKTEKPREQVETVTTDKQQKETEEKPAEPEQVVNPDALYKGPSKESSSSGNQGITGSGEIREDLTEQRMQAITMDQVAPVAGSLITFPDERLKTCPNLITSRMNRVGSS